MPIRLNLLAEAHAQEELRRRDPVKRCIWIGVAAVFVLLAWSSSLQLKILIAKGELNRLNGMVTSRTNEFQTVVAHQGKLMETIRKLSALQQLATNRLLHGTVLNAMQQISVEDVALTRLKADQIYVYNEGLKPKTNSNDRIIPGRPPSITEKIVVTIEGKDSSPTPGDQVPKFKQVVAESPYFQAALGKTNSVRLATLSPPQVAENKAFVLFTLECRFPEKTR
jgi:hypothetical protein